MVTTTIESVIAQIQVPLQELQQSAEYPHHTSALTPMCIGHSGTVLYETYVEGHESGHVYLWNVSAQIQITP